MPTRSCLPRDKIPSRFHSAAEIQSLCEPFLIKELIPGNPPLPDRSHLPHDHRCRCATDLMELASKVHRLVGLLQTAHEEEVSSLKRQLALARLSCSPWSGVPTRHETEYRQTSRRCDEVSSLKSLVSDLEEEKRHLRNKQLIMQHQIDSLFRQITPLQK